MKYLAILLLLVTLSFAREKPRVFLSNQQSWIEASNLVAPAATYAPDRTEQIGNLAHYCPGAVITEDRAKADLFLVWESKSYQQTRWGGHEHEWALYNADKEVIATGAEYHMKNAAKDICKAVTAASAKR